MKARERIKATIVVALGFAAFVLAHRVLVWVGADWSTSAASGLGAGLAALFLAGQVLR